MFFPHTSESEAADFKRVAHGGGAANGGVQRRLDGPLLDPNTEQEIQFGCLSTLTI